MDKRRMCPNCRAFITTADKKCPYCEAPVAPRAIDLRDTGAMIAGFIPQARFVTGIILLINVGLFIATSFGGSNLLFYGVKDAAAIRLGHQWYRLVTAGFLHGNFLHIFMNSWALYSVGAEVEEFFGPQRMVVIYFLATIGGFLMSAYLRPFTPSLGSSAGIMGLIGAMIAVGVRNKSSMGRAIRSHYVQWAVYGLVVGLLPGIDNYAHLGGIAAGFGAAYVAGTPAHSSIPTERLWRAAAALCVLLTALSFIQLYLHAAGPAQ